jgi:hypothetical protein
MARYQIVENHYNASHGGRWGIEKTVPGEKPVLLPFIGNRAKAEDEVIRLNRLEGSDTAASRLETPLTSRGREPTG